MSQKQIQRFLVMSLLEAGKITLAEAAGKIGKSYRQAKRIRKRVKGMIPAAAFGNRAASPAPGASTKTRLKSEGACPR